MAGGTPVILQGKKITKLNIFIIILVSVLILALSITAGVIGSKSGTDENCECISKINGGWRGFSIAYLILSILGIIVMLTAGVKKP
jgi:hypothetical protein